MKSINNNIHTNSFSYKNERNFINRIKNQEKDETIKPKFKKLKICGYASVYNITDYHGDIIVKGAFDKDIHAFNNHNRKIRLLAHHNTNKPIAKITYMEEKDDGLYIEAILEERKVDYEIYNHIKNDLVAELSVGIIPKNSYNNKGNRFINEACLIEISVVTIGANPKAKIIKVEELIN